MKKLLIFILFLPLLGACTKKPLFHNSKAPDIVAFGDSLTYGLGVSRDNAYPAVLSQLAGREIVNLGVSGNTAQQGAMRMHDIGKSMPCMVLIEFGGNDLLQNRPMEETRKALEEIIDYVHGLNAMAVIVDTGGNYQMSRYTKMMKKLAKKKNLISQFIKLYPDYTVERIHQHHKDEILEFCKTPRSRNEIAEFFNGRMTIAYVMERYVKPMIASGRLIMTIPEKPKSKYQKFLAR
jgi:lysophospholipase L1-like esterase